MNVQNAQKIEGGFTKCIPDLQGPLLQSSAALYLLQAVHDLKCLQQVHQTQNTATWTVPNGTWFGQMSFLGIPSTQTNGVYNWWRWIWKQRAAVLPRFNGKCVYRKWLPCPECDPGIQRRGKLHICKAVLYLKLDIWTV